MNELWSVSGAASCDVARGMTDVAAALKYLVRDSGAVQGSVGATHTARTGSGEFRADAPTYVTSANIAVALTSRLSFSVSLVFGTAIGPDAAGAAQAFFDFSISDSRLCARYSGHIARSGCVDVTAGPGLAGRQPRICGVASRSRTAPCT